MKQHRFASVALVGAVATVPFLSSVLAQDAPEQTSEDTEIRGLTPVQPAPGLLGVTADFDAEAWSKSLRDPDLDARERTFDRLVSTARGDADALAWLQQVAGADAAAGTDTELAWTARMALRELERVFNSGPFGAWSVSPGSFDELENWLDEATNRIAPGWNPRIDPLVIPFPGIHNQMPVIPGAGSGSQSRRVDIQNGSEGWTIRVTELVDGEESIHDYSGETLEGILAANPDLKEEINISGVLMAPGLSLRIGAAGDRPFDFEELFGNLAIDDPLLDRRQLRSFPLRSNHPQPKPVRTDVLGVNTRAANKAEGGKGLLVRSTESGTPAPLLGIVPGDILLELNGVTLSQVEDITRALALRGEDERIQAVWRDGEGRKRTGTWQP